MTKNETIARNLAEHHARIARARAVQNGQTINPTTGTLAAQAACPKCGTSTNAVIVARLGQCPTCRTSEVTGA